MSDINFSKLTWENLPARTTALSATNLNRIENGIADSVNGVNSNSHSIAELQTRISQIASGTPEPVNTIAEMTDHSKTYVYTGSEQGESTGYWYSYDSTQEKFVPRGEYGGAVTDTTLSIRGKAADAKAVGDAITLKADDADVTALDTKVSAVEGALEEYASDLDGLGQRVTVLEEGGGGITNAVKEALLAILRNVAYIGTDGQGLYDDLYDALYSVTAIRLDNYSLAFTTTGDTAQITATTVPAGGAVTWESSDTSVATVDQTGLVTSVGYGSAVITATSGSASASCSITVSQATISSISAVYTQSGTVYPTTALDTLKPDIVVTASWSDGTTSNVSSSMYVLSGTLSVGLSIVTVSYGGKTTTFSVLVSEEQAVLQSITATFTQGSAIIYENSSLNDLKQYLVVTATYSDATTATVTNYTLNGTLVAGTSTITVSYSGKTTTFNVTVSERPTLQSIVATFTQGSTVIYTDNTLDDLKPYLVVTANYSDSTTATVTNYTLSGTLVEGTSTITVTYSGKTTTFNVTVTKRATPPVPSLIYSLPETTTFNGTSDYIDTGLQLMGSNKSNFTIVFDVLDKSVPTASTQAVLLHCMHETRPWPGGVIQFLKGSGNYTDLNFAINSSTTSSGIYINNISSAGSEIREKFVGIVDLQSGTIKAIANVGGVDNVKSKTLPSDISSTVVTETALIGCYQDLTGTKGRFWTGTIYDFKIYNYAWSETEANAYLQEDHS